MTFNLKYYLSVFWRRSPFFLIAAGLFTSLGLTLAALLPAEYSARALLLFESEQIPSSLAMSTVRTEATEQLQIIEQRMMTRENLLDIADRLGVYDNLRASGEIITASEIVEDMRRRTTFSSTSGKKNTATVVTISFRSSQSVKAAEVTNEFVTLVLQDNVEMRTNRAQGTLEFFQQERDRLGGNLDAQSAEILKFQTENSGALPDNRSELTAQSGRLNESKATRNREIDALEAQRKQIVSIFERTGGTSTDGPKSPAQTALDNARRELDNARLVYSDQNPKLRVLAARVEQLEQRLSETLAAGIEAENTSEGTASEAETLYAAQLAQIDSDISFRRDEIDRIDQQLASIDETLKRIPSNAIALDKLQRDYSNIQEQYNRTVATMSQAATGERIELLAKGQRISVIEQATPPEKPSKPNRLLISAGGAGVGVAVGAGLVFLMELLSKAIRRPSEITAKLGITPIAALPYIRTEREAVTKRFTLASVIVFFVMVLPFILFMVHRFYYPLDGLIEPFANKMGFSVSS